MKFVGKIRIQSNSMVVTIPTVVVEALELKVGEIAFFNIQPTKNKGGENE